MLRGKKIEDNQITLMVDIDTLIGRVNELIKKVDRLDDKQDILRWKVDDIFEWTNKTLELAGCNNEMLIKPRMREKRQNKKNPGNPFINSPRQDRPESIIVKDKRYTSNELASMFKVTRVTIINRINALAKMLKTDTPSYFYKKDNGYKNGDTKGKKWIVTPMGVRKLAETFEIEVIN